MDILGSSLWILDLLLFGTLLMEVTGVAKKSKTSKSDLVFLYLQKVSFLTWLDRCSRSWNRLERTDNMKLKIQKNIKIKISLFNNWIFTSLHIFFQGLLFSPDFIWKKTVFVDRYHQMWSLILTWILLCLTEHLGSVLCGKNVFI